jgi:hypothetical protein
MVICLYLDFLRFITPLYRDLTDNSTFQNQKISARPHTNCQFGHFLNKFCPKSVHTLAIYTNDNSQFGHILSVFNFFYFKNKFISHISI